MTPKEKANNIEREIYLAISGKCINDAAAKAATNKFALIAVDQIQETYMSYVRDGRIEPISNPTIFEYCEQLRQEIEKL
jgi:hypothetical protein